MKLVAFLLAVFLFGCSYDTKIVKVPVPIAPPAVEMPQKPELLSKNITEDTPNDLTLKYLLVDYDRLMTYSTSLERIIKLYQADTFEKYKKEMETEITISGK